MRVNCHTHIFNAKSVFNKYTIEILINRLTEVDLPEPVKEAVMKQLRGVISDAGDYIDEKSFFQRVLAKVSATNEYKDMLDKAKPALKTEFEIIGSERIEEASADALTRLITKISDALNPVDKDVRSQDVMDFMDFLRIGFQPSVRNVTDIILRQLPNKTDAIVALMMDITEDGQDNGQFERQVKETSDMVLAYPGRVFPFFAVNPNRPDHFQIMERALNGLGFVGIKLYPSLGYAVDSPAMQKVYAYCDERRIPILMHCTKGGFKHSDAFTDNSSPLHWKQILQTHNNLKICFGHFGGDEFHAALPEIDGTPPWGPVILNLMEQYPNVYADIAFHTAPMDGGDQEATYFNNMKKYLAHNIYKERILWGSDFFLVRRRLREKNHWRYMQEKLGGENFNRIADSNTARYLGFDSDQMSWALTNYIQFVARHAQQVETQPPAWLTKAVRNAFGDTVVFDATPLGRAWSLNNKAHVTLYEDFNASEFLESTSFEQSGAIKLSAMAYWRDLRLGSAQMARMNLRRRSVKLIKTFKRNGAKMAVRSGKPLTEDHVIKIVTPVLKNGSKTVAELGAICDSLFEFKTA